MKVFDKAFAWILEAEGGYVNHPSDPGGETKYGISKRAFPYLDIKHLSQSKAKQIYRHDYWHPCKCDALPPLVDIVTFDLAVNSGRDFAGKALQRSINLREDSQNKLVVDGIIGERTVTASHRQEPELLAHTVISCRDEYYTNLAGRPQYEPFTRGWINRNVKLKKFLGIMP